MVDVVVRVGELVQGIRSDVLKVLVGKLAQISAVWSETGEASFLWCEERLKSTESRRQFQGYQRLDNETRLAVGQYQSRHCAQ